MYGGHEVWGEGGMSRRQGACDMGGGGMGWRHEMWHEIWGPGGMRYGGHEMWGARVYGGQRVCVWGGGGL